MKKYNYENLKEDAHVYEMWKPFNFKIKKNYKFVPNNVLFNLFSNFLAIIVNFLLIIINKVLFGYKVINRKNIVKGGKVSISRHIHQMDCTIISLIYAPKRVYYPTLQDNFNIPFIRHLIRALYAVPIPNDSSLKEKFYNEINNVLKKGKVVQMYPEGSMWPYYDKTRNFKYGAFKMAVDADVPVQLIKFIYKEPTGIYKIYKKNKLIQAEVLEAIYPNKELNYEERIFDLKERCYERLK